MRKIILFILILMSLIFLSTGFTFGKVIATLNEVMNPEFIVLDNERLYVAEKTSVLIYSLKDFKLLKKFGKKGEGPKEFIGRVGRIVPVKDYILVNSLGKMSFYSKDGDYLKEKKTGNRNSNFSPLNSGFLGLSITTINKKIYSTICMFDKNLKKGKILFKTLFGAGGKIDLFGAVRSSLFYVYKNKIYALNENGEVNIFDELGEKLKTISFSKEKLKFTKADEKEVRKLLKKEMPVGQYEALKNLLSFSEFYPELQRIMISNDTVYMISFKREQGKYETYIYDLKGKLIKKTLIKCKLKNGIQPYPFDIKNSKTYQLIENEETEDWELHVNNIK